MADITFPREILTGFPGWSKTFDLFYRQDRSRAAGGVTYTKDFGSPLWKAEYVSAPLRPNSLDRWRAIIDSLDGGIQTFKGWHLARKYPIAYPRGTFPAMVGGAAFSGVGALSFTSTSRKNVDISGFPPAYKFSVGDLIQIGSTDLHRVMNDVVANGSGVAAGVEIRPGLWAGVNTGAVNVVKPACLMILDPDSISSEASEETGWGSISFTGVEFR